MKSAESSSPPSILKRCGSAGPSTRIYHEFASSLPIVVRCVGICHVLGEDVLVLQPSFHSGAQHRQNRDIDNRHRPKVPCTGLPPQTLPGAWLTRGGAPARVQPATGVNHRNGCEMAVLPQNPLYLSTLC